MKLKKLKVTILLLLCVVFNTLIAQDTIFVKSNNRNISPYLISTLQSFTFPTGSIQVNKLDGTNSSFLTSSINKLFFGKIVTTGFSDTEYLLNELSLYPNPVLDQLQIEYLSTTLSLGEISILDINGKVVLEEKIINVIGENKQIIDISALTLGIYLCRINSGNKMNISKFIKSN
jgi:hypothetical protein